MKNQKGFIIPIVIIISILILGTVAYFFFPKPINSVIVKNPTASPVATVDPTANWKIYTNNNFGFKSKYDQGLIFTEKNGEIEPGQFNFLFVTTFASGESNLWHSQNGYEIEISKKSLIDYRDEIVGHIADEVDSEQTTVINDKVWTKIKYKIFITTNYVPITKAIINNNGYSYSITASDYDIDQILSTFKFTN